MRTGEPWMMPETDGDHTMPNRTGIQNVAEEHVQGHVLISTRVLKVIDSSNNEYSPRPALEID